MARKPSIWYRKQTGWYMTTFRGEQVKLSQDRKEAEKAFHTLLAQEEPAEEKGGLRPSFRKVADLFLEEAERTKAPGTYAVQKAYLQSFCDFVGRRKVSDLKVHHVTEWLNAHNTPGPPRGKKNARAKKAEPVRFPAWGESTRTTARSILRACLNWAVQQGYVPTNPLAKLKRGEFARRERILSADEKRRIAEWLPEGIREFVYAIEQTGARPYSELARLTADMIDFGAGTITFAKHKNAGKGKRRVIYMTEGLAAMLRGLAAEHPQGLLFRTRTGRPWNQGTALKWMRKVEAALGIPRLNPYAWRHTYITEALVKGISAEVVAELVGNSPATIHRYYCHVGQKTDALKAAAAKAVA